MQTHSTTKWKEWSRNPYFSPYLYLWRSFPQRHTKTPTAYCRLRERFQLSDQLFFLLYISVFASQIHFTTVQSFMNMTFSWCSSLDLDMSAITSLRNPHPLGTTHNKEKKEWGESFASINLFSFRQKPVSQWCQICVGMLKHNSSPLSLAMFFSPNQGNYLFGYHFFSHPYHIPYFQENIAIDQQAQFLVWDWAIVTMVFSPRDTVVWNIQLVRNWRESERQMLQVTSATS